MLRVTTLLLIALLAGCIAPAMYKNGITHEEVNRDAEYCKAIAESDSRRGIEGRLAAYKACMMEKGYSTEPEPTRLPVTLSATERSITIAVGTDRVSRQQADRIARDHCANFGLKPQQAADVAEPSGTARVSYHCVP